MTTMPAGSDTASFYSASEDQNDLMRIGDVAKMFDVSLRTLRFYEDKGLIQPKREGMTRLYSARDLSRLKLITFGTRVGFSLREIKQMMDLYDPSGTNMRQYRFVLDKSERQIGRLEEQRRQLDAAIQELEEMREGIRSVVEERQRNAA
ncbi:MerR family transcriptional regulator [Aliihoeflea aestuarii]|jgi:DNA-binding transcriptional MerR regulator|uniref:MerR family transcriptional regulator n=1 Tax=Aliihoeflea aestuarii TaxID=453840 RepID=UPI0027E30262|nr:MerR family DNA-binding transcriptional regulator [Aliihoeflea aestuarii]